ncbi:MAG: TldD/PmbA family protein [Thermoplasmatota archaeon]
MVEWTGDELLSLATRAVRMAISRGVDEAEAFVTRGAEVSVELEGGRIRYPLTTRAMGISIRTMRGGRVGFAYCTRARHIEATIRRALDIARLERRLRIGFPDPSPVRRPPGTWDERVPAMTVDEAMAFCADMMGEARRTHRDIRVTGGGVECGWALSAIANSRGMEFAEGGTSVAGGINVSLRGRVESTGFEHMSSRFLDIDFGRLGREAAALALRGRNSIKTSPGRRAVLLMPEAAAALLSHITIPSLHGEPVRRGESHYSGRLGERVAARQISLIDDGLLPGGLATSAVDDEGVPSRRRHLIREGVLEGLIFDLRSAAEVGGRSTGNGVRPTFRSPPVASARNVIVEGPLRPRDALVSEMKDGLIVHDVLGAHTASARSGDFSVSAPVCFEVRRGEVGRPLRPVMISGNLHSLLRRVTGLGSDIRQVPAGLASFVTGSLVLESVMVTV